MSTEPGFRASPLLRRRFPANSRLSSPRRRPSFARASAAAAILGLLAAACPGPPAPPPPPPGGILLAGAPADAVVSIDERTAGTIEQLSRAPIHLSPGVYRIEVEAPGHFPGFAEATVGETVETVRIELRPIPE